MENTQKQSNNKKIILIVVSAVVAILVAAYIFGEKVPIVSNTDGIVITADEISDKFLKDKTGSEEEFHNKVYEITGEIKDINPKYSVTLMTESEEYEIYIDIDNDNSNKIPDLKKGDTITMKGLYSDVRTDRIDFKNAVYVSSVVATEPTTEPTTESTTVDEEKYDSPVDRENIIQVLSDFMEQGFDKKYFTVEYNEEINSYLISLWKEDIVILAMQATTNDEMKAGWDEMARNIADLSKQLQTAAKELDENANVTINILNEENIDNILLMAYNGRIMYDATED